MKDITELIATVTAFCRDNAAPLILAGLAVTVALLVWVVRRTIRSERPDNRLAMFSLIIGFAWSAEAMWEVATQKLNLAPAFAVFAFVIFESQLAVAMIRAERNQRLHKHPGKHGQAAWLTAIVMGCIAAAAGDSLVEVLLRLAVPLLVTHQWWVGMIGDGVTKPADSISWTWTPRRVLVEMGLARPGTKDLVSVDRERHITSMVKLRHQLLTATKPKAIQRLTAKLHKLVLTADASMLDEVREKISLVQDATERTRPLEADEHAVVAAARTEADHARQQADHASAAAEAARIELAQLREALEHSSTVSGRSGEQIRQLQEQLQRARRDADQNVQEVRRDAELAIAQIRREAAAEVAVVRHEAELAAAAALRSQPVTANGHNGYAAVSAAGSSRGSLTSVVPSQASEQTSGEAVALPATAQACTEWMALWVKVCQELPAVALGSQPISEETAKARFNCSVRHLRKVRNAARLGALRQKAQELGAEVPDNYVNEPAAAVNGYAAVS